MTTTSTATKPARFALGQPVTATLLDGTAVVTAVARRRWIPATHSTVGGHWQYGTAHYSGSSWTEGDNLDAR